MQLLRAVTVAAVVLAAGCVTEPTKEPYAVLDLPVDESPVLPLDERSADDRYPRRGASDAAVLMLHGENAAGPVQVLKTMGVPFFVTRDLDEALQARFIVVYPFVRGDDFTPADVDRLHAWVESGGVIVAQEIYARILWPLFGFASATPSRSHDDFALTDEADPGFAHLDAATERKIPLRRGLRANETVVSTEFDPLATADVLARYEDGSAAMLRHRAGSGATYVLGVSLDETVLRNQAYRTYGYARAYINTFEAGGDAWQLMLRDWYRSAVPNAVTLHTIPNGHDGVLMITMDVDAQTSFPNMPAFAAAQKELGIQATYFVQTKYVEDFYDTVFLTPTNVDAIRKARELGAVIQSHSVAHAPTFDQFPYGTGTERYPDYRPFVKSRSEVANGTLLGELRVSKSLLDGFLAGQNTTAFRAGHLIYPAQLPLALEQTGYLFDATIPAGETLTSFPFRAVATSRTVKSA